MLWIVSIVKDGVLNNHIQVTRKTTKSCKPPVNYECTSRAMKLMITRKSLARSVPETDGGCV